MVLFTGFTKGLLTLRLPRYFREGVLGGSVALGLLHNVLEVVDHMMVSGTAAHFSTVIVALSKLGNPLLR